MNYRNYLLALSMVPTLLMSTTQVLADSVSEAFDKNPTVYSKEKPNKAYFGTGESGRLSEASSLRFQGEQDLSDGNIDLSIREFAKAVELDPGDPTGHVLYARAITKKFYAQKGEVDEKLLQRCIREWRLVWFHDADYLEQCEAKVACRPLIRIAHALEKAKKDKQKLLEEEAKKKALVAEKSDQPSDDKTANSKKPDSDDDVQFRLPPGAKAPPVNADPAITD